MAASVRNDDLKLRFGIEEEFFLVDPQTRDLLAEPDVRIFDDCVKNAGAHKVSSEFLRSQIETATCVCDSMAELRAALRETRALVTDAASKFGAAALASSTHPFAAWHTQVVSVGRRYQEFAMTYQEAVRRLLVGGMHIHVGFGNRDSRIRVMTALRRHLPLLHALSGSSPFNSGRETGFKSYRLTIFGSLPRTGIPGPLRSWADFEALVSDFRRMDLIGGPGELWWDIRPSHAYPTIELRICDVCPRANDAMAVATLYACLVRKLLRQELEGKLPSEPPSEIIAENRWLAGRYGMLAFFGISRAAAVLISRTMPGIWSTSWHLTRRPSGAKAVCNTCSDIVRAGAGADRQVDLFRLLRLEGATPDEALRAVVDLVIRETKQQLD